jgi:hypothetical protein
MTTLRLAYGHRAPPAEEVPDLLDLWLAMFDPLADDSLAAACRAHIADPDAGRFWPTPADILRHARPPARDHEATFDAILRRIAGGNYTADDLLDDAERRALASIGGVWSLRMADTERQLPRLRRQFAAACKAPTPAEQRAIAARQGFRALLGGKGGAE